MGNGGPQVNSVLWLPDGYSSYGDERWRVRKLLMSTFQIWPQKNFFACGSPESRKGSDVTGAMWEVRIHHKRVFCDIESFVARTETSNGALESWWWVHPKSNLKFFFLAIWSPESRGGGKWRHWRCGKCIYTRKERFVPSSILLLVQRRAIARSKADNE